MPHNTESDIGFKSLFQFIRKNTFIHKKLENIPANDPKTDALLQAIHRGDINAEIFNDPDCQFYLLYLIKKNKISFWSGMYVYAFILALMQYTKRQQFKVEDQFCKLLDNNNTIMENIEVVPLIEGNSFTPKGEKYLNKLNKKFKKLNFNINFDQLKEFILSLSYFDQLLLKIPLLVKTTDSKDQDGYAWLQDAMIRNAPFLKTSKTKKYFYLPSYSIINFILKALFNDPIVMRIVFGKVGLQTLKALHENGEHPVAMYSSLVRDNLLKAHDCVNPFIIWLHDILHVFMGSMLKRLDRNTVFEIFISELEKWKVIAQEQEDQELIEAIEHSLERANDFDLTPIDAFENSDTRLYEYCARSFFEEGVHFYFLFNTEEFRNENIDYDPEDLTIETPSDKLYFLICSAAYRQGVDSKIKNLFIKILEIVDKNLTDEHRTQPVINAIKKMANNAEQYGTNRLFANGIVQLPKNKKKQVLALLTLTKETTDINQLTNNLLSSLKNFVLYLITHCGLIFLPPIIPMTSEKRVELIEFLENQECLSSNSINSSIFHTTPAVLFSENAMSVRPYTFN